MRPLLLVAVVVPSFCGPTPPERRAIPAGRYAYEASLLLPEATDSTRYAGTLVLDRATPDSLVGRWAVPGYDPVLRDNYWNVVSFHVTARIGGGADTLTIVHAIKPGATPTCRAAVMRLGYWKDGRCVLRLTPPR